MSGRDRPPCSCGDNKAGDDSSSVATGGLSTSPTYPWTRISSLSSLFWQEEFCLEVWYFFFAGLAVFSASQQTARSFTMQFWRTGGEIKCAFERPNKNGEEDDAAVAASSNLEEEEEESDWKLHFSDLSLSLSRTREHLNISISKKKEIFSLSKFEAAAHSNHFNAFQSQNLNRFFFPWK